MSLLLRDATIIAGPDHRLIPRGWIRVTEGLIAALGEGDPPPEAMAGAAVMDCRRRLAAPGLVNAHTHSQSATLAGFGDRLSHPAFMWRTLARTANRTPRETALAVQLTAWWALSTGTTALLDHFPGQLFAAEDIEAAIAAWHTTGLRAVVGLRFFDAGFADILPPGLPPDADGGLLRPQPLESFAEIAGDAIARWHGHDGRIGVFPAPSNPDRCTDAALRLCADLAERHDTGLHTHLLETATQAAQARARFGMGSLERLEALGILSDRWSCAHCIHLSEAEIALMARRGAAAVLNPESNARLGVGLAPIPTLREAGVRLALATDGPGSNDNLSMHEAMRGAAVAHRSALPDRARWLTAAEALRAATTGGAAALRMPKLGVLAPGFAADIALYDLATPGWLPLNDAVAQLVFAETGAAVRTVIVGGEILLQDGRPTRFDPAALAEEVLAMQDDLTRRNAALAEAAEAIGARLP
ncbi:amidohydrolase family protein [Falsiroseomonas oryziterrae]|uniref:amidohydrolase family protein n=1 Tax=Falsiroseomonas oryziterrae TaxID=2911368 RepID=UPI001F430298|nr:amidohydrolase family protein [Roseomonas sp. NPKOSM-4]